MTRNVIRLDQPLSPYALHCALADLARGERIWVHTLAEARQIQRAAPWAVRILPGFRIYWLHRVQPVDPWWDWKAFLSGLLAVGLLGLWTAVWLVALGVWSPWSR
jgi:hypothetical protein